MAPLQLQGRQANQPLARQLLQQTAGGKVFEFSPPIAPVPMLTKFPGQPAPTPVRVLADPLAQPAQLIQAETAPLTNDLGDHAELIAEGEKKVPKKMRVSFRQSPDRIGFLPTPRECALSA